ncbi:hypothetical protein KLP28_03675 [Nocardioidaceae bacterium]|nr:hypothetical protein KLP28_03675 [Nocardioidaceae bacterium]
MSRTPAPRRLGRRCGALLLVPALVALTACTPSLTDEAREQGSATSESIDEPYDTAVCAAVRDGIDAYNIGDLEESVQAFDDALPLARTHAAQQGAGEGARAAQALLEAVRYYAGLSVTELRDAFPASRDTVRYQQTTLEQCQPLPPGLEDESEQLA